MSIGQTGAVANLTSLASMNTTLQANVQSAQTAEVEALFNSLGLGQNANTVA